jgi:hypothetical protein
MNIIEQAILVAICAGVLATSFIALAIAPRGYRAAASASVLVFGFGWIVVEAIIGEFVLSRRCQPASISRTVIVSTFLERSSDGYCYSCNLGTLRAGYDAVEFFVNDARSLTGREFGADAPGYYRFQFSTPDSPYCLRSYRPIVVRGKATCLAAERIKEPASSYEAVYSNSEERTSLGKLSKREQTVRRIADGEIFAHHVHYRFISQTYLGRILSSPGEPSFGGAYCRTPLFDGPTVVLLPQKQD